MSEFTIRVVLRNHASEAAYDTLHAKMEANGFYRKIQGMDGIWYDLPHAEYQGSKVGTRETVREWVAQIAREVDANNRVRVTEGLSAWQGLEKSAYKGGPEWYDPSGSFALSSLLLGQTSPTYQGPSPIFAPLLAPPKW